MVIESNHHRCPGISVIRPLALTVALLAAAGCAPGQSTAGPNYLGMPHAPTTTLVEPDQETVTSQHCGTERWPIKTGSDPDAARINLTITPTTVAALTAFPTPRTLSPTHRVPPVEFTTYTVHATLTGFTLEADSDYHLVLSDAGRTMIVELPAPVCVAPDPLKARIVTARKQFDARYHPGPGFRHVNVPVTITGVGFFDSIHGQAGVAVNGIELHPVLNITFGPVPIPF
jgi:hypothetical protein